MRSAERGRHQEVFAGDVNVEALHGVEVLEVLLGHERDRDVENGELVLLHEVKQQIEWALEDVEGDLVSGLVH